LWKAFSLLAGSALLVHSRRHTLGLSGAFAVNRAPRVYKRERRAIDNLARAVALCENPKVRSDRNAREALVDRALYRLKSIPNKRARRAEFLAKVK
jgi:hypothetical protein